MKRLLLSFLCALVCGVLLASSGASHAANVLLPKDTGASSEGTSSLPNLGLSVKPDTRSKFTESNSSLVDKKIQELKKNGAAKVETKKNTNNADSNKNNSLNVTQKTDISGLYAVRDKNLPNALTISMSKQSSYGANDTAAISGRLGLKAGQIPSSCLLSVDGRLYTERGEREIYGGASSQVSVRYEGGATGVALNARALCIVNGNIPAGSQVTKIDNRYVIPLQSFSCPPPRAANANLVVTYDGAAAKCDYR